MLKSMLLVIDYVNEDYCQYHEYLYNKNTRYRIISTTVPSSNGFIANAGTKNLTTISYSFFPSCFVSKRLIRDSSSVLAGEIRMLNKRNTMAGSRNHWNWSS